MSAFDRATMCGAAGRRCRKVPPTCNHADGDHRCRLGKGFGTDHPGKGHCKFHGGGTPNGKREAAREAVEEAVAKLGLPRGNGDPIALLANAVRHAEGYLEATAAVVADASSDDTERSTAAKLELEAALAAYETAIRQAATTGAQTVNAKVAEQLAAVETKKIELLQLAVQRALDRTEPDPAWRDRFVVALGEELLAVAAPPALVH